MPCAVHAERHHLRVSKIVIDHHALPRRTILGLCCIGMTTLSLLSAGPSACLTAIARDLVLDEAQKGVLLSALFWGFPIAVVISGPLADRFGFRWLLVVGAVLQSVGLYSIASADGLAAAVVGAVILGVGSGATDALLTPVVCVVYPERRTAANNLLHAFFPIGLVVNIALVLALLYIEWPWRPIFRLLGLLPLPYAVAAALITLPANSHQGPERQRTRGLLFQLSFILLAGGLLFAGLTEITAGVWLPNFLEVATQTSQTKSVLALLLFGVTMALGRLSASAMVKFWGARGLVLAGSVLCAVSLVMVSLNLGANFTIACFCVLGFGVASYWPTILGCAGDHYPQAGASMYSALTAAGIMGGAIGPFVVGLVADAYNQQVAMGTLAIAPVVAVLLLLRLLKGR